MLVWEKNKENVKKKKKKKIVLICIVGFNKAP